MCAIYMPAIKRLICDRARYILDAAGNEMFAIHMPAIKRLICERARYQSS
jgi:hypothetical protein